MLYYELNIKVNGEITDLIAKKCVSDSAKDDPGKAIIRRLNMAAKRYLSGSEDRVFYFSDYGEDKIYAVAGYDYNNLSEIKNDAETIFKKLIDRKVNVTVNEITVKYFMNRLENICSMDFARLNMHTITRKLKIDYMDNRTYSVEQSIIPEERLAYDEAMEKAHELLTGDDFADELKRIYSDKHPKEFYGHPVHYKISADMADSAIEEAKLLTRCLYSNGRLKGRRIDCINKITDNCYEEDDMRNLFYNAEGAAVVIELMPHDEEEGNYASTYEQVIEFLSGLIRKYANNVLIILIEVTRMQGLSKKLVSKVADDIDIVSIGEGEGDAKAAEKYMDYLIKNSSLSGFDADNISFDKEKYKASEVHSMFNSWLKSSLKERVYTEYSSKSVKIEENKEETSDAYKRLQCMVGLNDVKSVIDNIIAAYKIQKLRDGYQKSENAASRHMIFTGNPGSAKTTVARLVAEILKKEQVLETGAFVECGRADLVGKYVGWTAPQVKSKFRQAQGGVLFIDEAYSLVDDSGSFADEAIDTIVQEMENNRDSVIVIFAGYPDKMRRFIEKNDGLKSRIAFHVDFPDYNADELLEIFKLMMKEREYTMTKAAERTVLGIFKKAQYVENFGNGRFARNVLEQASMRQSARLMKSGFSDVNDKATLFRLEKDDFNLPALIPQENIKTPIGFIA